MAKNITISLLAIILITSMCLGLAGCNTEYGSIPIELKYPVDNVVPMMTGDKTASEQKGNPDRGFSINAYMTLDDSSVTYKETYAFPSLCMHAGHIDENGNAKKTQAYLDEQFKKYAEYNPHVVVMTVFLSNYVDKDLTDNALGQIMDMIRSFKIHNNKANVIVKFGYQHTSTDKIPAINIVLKHIEQIGSLVANNVNTIKGLVSAFRVSFAGIDGNFENVPYSPADTKKLLDGFSRMIPSNSNLRTQSPNVSTKNLFINPEPLINMGFFNEHIDGSMNTYVSGGTDKKHDNYRQYVYQSIFNYNSAVISANMQDINGKDVLRLLKDGYFSTLDIENIVSKIGDASPLLDLWKATTISKKDLDALNLPYYDEWFLSSEGASQNRSVYDYLRDFVGYNLAVTSLKFEKTFRKDPKDGVEKLHTTITFVVTNYGMAAPLGIDKFEMFIKNNATGNYIQGGKGIAYPETYDREVLVSGGQIQFKQLVIGDIDKATGNNIDPSMGHSIGLRIASNHNSKPVYVRLANNVPYTDNINWIYSTK